MLVIRIRKTMQVTATYFGLRLKAKTKIEIRTRVIGVAIKKMVASVSTAEERRTESAAMNSATV
jgi:hypothetical protein